MTGEAQTAEEREAKEESVVWPLVLGYVLLLGLIILIGVRSTFPSYYEVQAPWPYTTADAADARLDRVHTWHGLPIQGHMRCADAWDYDPIQSAAGEDISASFQCTLFNGTHGYAIWMRLRANHTWLIRVDDGRAVR